MRVLTGLLVLAYFSVRDCGVVSYPSSPDIPVPAPHAQADGTAASPAAAVSNELLDHSSVTPAPLSQTFRTISVSDKFLTTLLRSGPAVSSSTSAEETETPAEFTMLQCMVPSSTRPPARRLPQQGSRRVLVRRLVPVHRNPLPPPVPTPPVRITTTTTTTTTQDPTSLPDYEYDDDEEEEALFTATTSRPRIESLLRVSPLTDLTTIESLRNKPPATSPTPQSDTIRPSPTARRPPHAVRATTRRTLLTSTATASTSPSTTTTTTTTSAPTTTVTNQSVGRVTGGISRPRTKPSRLTVISVFDLTTKAVPSRSASVRRTTAVPTTLVPNTGDTEPTTIITTTTSPPSTTRKPVRNFRSNTTTSKAPEFSEEELAQLTVPGVPGVDYPVYRDIPLTAFDCRNTEYPGFYADIDTGCQVYHSCGARSRRHSFLCPNGTIFSQEYLICDWWYNVQCTESSNHYQLNKDAFSSPPSSVSSRERDSNSENNENSNLSSGKYSSNGSEERVVVINLPNQSENKTAASEQNDERDSENLSSAASSSSSSSSSSSA